MAVAIIHGIKLGSWRRWRWLAVMLLTTYITVQLVPYGALAAVSPWATRQTPAVDPTPNYLDMLAQLEQLPGGSVALPNFDPAVNGFQFSNQELTQAIDITRNPQAWEEVLTEQLQQLFGTQVCIGGESTTCVLTAAAQSWLQTQLGRMNQGLSEGMAAAVLDLWQPGQPRLPWWQRLVNALLGRTVFGLVRTLFDLQTFIANLFLMQGVTEVAQQTQTVRDTFTPTQILRSLLGVFLGGSLDPFTMGVYRRLEGALTEGHSLTPYRVEDQGQGKYWVYVYDSNYPAGRPGGPTDLHVEFDTQADTWTYQPIASGPVFEGDDQSKTLDLTQRSWRQPPDEQPLAATGPFTCPFCYPGAETEAEAGIKAAPTVDITLIGEGLLTVIPYEESADADLAPLTLSGQDVVELVPFKGGLNREVPASYRLSAAQLGHPLQVTLTGVATAPDQTATLQLTGPGYTANVEELRLDPSQSLTLFLVANATGPEITLVANRATDLPRLSISLTDDTSAYQFNSSSPETGFSITDRQVSKSSGFDLSGLKLPAGQRVALAANTDLKRLYFADDTLASSQYALTVKNRIVIKDRIQLGERQPDFVNYTLAYDEEMRASGVEIESQRQAFFDYDPAFVDPAELPRQTLLEAFDQRDFPIAVAYEPLMVSANGPSPLRLVPSGREPVGQRVFQGSLRKAGGKG
ncbi:MULTISPECIES: hypothetical protein [Cyanophyceae]|uniref:hypothetical protein n=1 Tax=Cyanophyceae TaxID=3028117 RepID=UPI001686D7CC|nr:MULTISPECIES: hypothetical protein [Cyanophyceae]MBD1917769.1 hypothetical protein [Phormidium sp. FACHB-77]MBD2032888.1 hypothetical protein [Phormidium sp. FACHB-322]MBD2051635.1 hypothetical protein [Leptolyngbya sp. FACHB-60]